MPIRHKKVEYPSFVGKCCTCLYCGGKFRVRKKSRLVGFSRTNGDKSVSTNCPYCNSSHDLDTDLDSALRLKLSKFVFSQVSPIKSIEDEKVRLPMQKLLDDFNRLLQED